MEPWVVILIVLVLIIGAVVYLAAQDPKPKAKPPERAQRERDVPLRRASPNINVPSPVLVNEAPATNNGGGFIPVGAPEDPVGSPVLARKIDIARSDFWIKPEATLFPPGTPALMEARIVDANSQPLADVPVVWKFRGRESVDLNMPVRTDAQGVATFVYTVREADQIGDPSTPEPDTGSRLIVCYAGGRKLTRVRPLHDVY